MNHPTVDEIILDHETIYVIGMIKTDTNSKIGSMH